MTRVTASTYARIKEEAERAATKATRGCRQRVMIEARNILSALAGYPARVPEAVIPGSVAVIYTWDYLGSGKWKQYYHRPEEITIPADAEVVDTPTMYRVIYPDGQVRRISRSKLIGVIVDD